MWITWAEISVGVRGVLLSALVAHPVAAQDLPGDVAAFLEARQQCEHFLGEEPYDAERATQIEAALNRFCRGTDAQLAELKRKYRAGPPAIREVLAALEERIE